MKETDNIFTWKLRPTSSWFTNKIYVMSSSTCQHGDLFNDVWIQLWKKEKKKKRLNMKNWRTLLDWEAHSWKLFLFAFQFSILFIRIWILTFSFIDFFTFTLSISLFFLYPSFLFIFFFLSFVGSFVCSFVCWSIRSFVHSLFFYFFLPSIYSYNYLPNFY